MDPSDKETRAIFLNFKEVRTLERNFQSLDGEQSYYISLINLDQKIVKVHYKRLKDKVSKIKSHLSKDEIKEIKHLDDAGNLPYRPNSSRLDSSLRIEAAERRLKLMPRAKSATPRLVNRPVSSGRTIRRPKTPSVVRTTTRPLTSPQTRSSSSSKLNVPMRSAKSASCRTPRRLISCQTSASEDEDYHNLTPVPLSVRRDRKQSIYSGDDDSVLNVNHVTPRPNNSLSIPSRTNSFGSRSSISLGRNPTKVTRASSVSSNVEIKIESVDDIEIDDDKGSCVDSKTSNIVSVKRNMTNGNAAVPRIDLNESGDDKSLSVNKFNSEDKCENVTTPASIVISKADNKAAISSTGVDTFSTNVETSKANDVPTKVNALIVSGVTNTENSSSSMLKPTYIPATEINEFSKHHATGQSKGTSTQRAFETRKKSIMNIRKASALLAEGKTRTPFNCHDAPEGGKMEKPFRSIRDGALTCTDIDKEILDSNIGNDLYKEIKKGILLGEFATSLCLEDKIDTFLDKVDGYVKENPNYIYDPDVTRAELLEKAREAKKAKPKRNRLRRRQLERRLAECDINEMKKSRWLRHDDEELDTTGVNTLVVDQMKMLNSIKFSYDSD